jgi:LysM repeat protein
VIKSASYLSASALLMSAAVHALILTLLVASGDKPESGESAAPSQPSQNATAEDGRLDEKAEGERDSVADRDVVPPAVSQGVGADEGPKAADKKKSAEKNPAASPAVQTKNGGAAEKVVERKTSGGEKPSGAGADAPEKKIETVVYTVRRGDTLTKLAEKCGMSISELAKLNGKSVQRLSNLWVGQKIKIKAGADFSR